ncbi:hypothetical protein TNCV_2603541 [Trichonephila clavipes]|nr:hypothetical protein TNCV_2603541 [Trichonephila clavipes]
MLSTLWTRYFYGVATFAVLFYAGSYIDDLETRIKRKHIFGDRSKDAQLLFEDDLRRTMFSSINRVTAEIRERFQQLQGLK